MGKDISCREALFNRYLDICWKIHGKKWAVYMSDLNRRAYTTTDLPDMARVLLVHRFSIYAEFCSYIAAGIFPAFADDARRLENSKKIKPIKIDIFHV